MNIEGQKDTEEGAKYRYLKHNFTRLTPQQIETYIDNNITDLASAKNFLKILAKILVMSVKHQLNS